MEDLIEKIEAVQLAPGDTVILTTTRRMTPRECKLLGSTWEATLPDTKAIVLGYGMTLHPGFSRRSTMEMDGCGEGI